MGKDINRAMSLVILLVVAATAVSASTVVPLSFKELSTRAHRVAAGRVEHLTSYRDAASGRIFTKVEMAETQSVSGAAPAGSFTFEMAGGTADGVRQWIAGFPSLAAGDRVVLFLAEDTSTPGGPTVGLWQGVFFVETDGSGVETVTNHARRPVTEIRGDQLVLGETPPGGRVAQSSGSRVTLDSFLNRVRSWRQALPAAAHR